MRQYSSLESQQKNFIRAVLWSHQNNTRLDILCIAGALPLVIQLRWLYDWHKQHSHSKRSTIRIVSVEASVYNRDSTIPLVNHNPQINPNLEVHLQEIKLKLRDYADITHFSLSSENRNVKITRSSCAAYAIDNPHTANKLQAILDTKLGYEKARGIHSGTTVYPLPSHIFSTIKQSSTTTRCHSTFLHDLKALFVLHEADRLEQNNILEPQRRQAIHTEKGSIFFTDDLSIDDCLLTLRQLTSDERDSIRQRNEELDSSYGLQYRFDTRLVINPNQVTNFNKAFSDWLEYDNGTIQNPTVIITDPGHGYPEKILNPFVKQDSDDHAVWEIVAQMLRQANHQGTQPPPVIFHLNDDIHPLYLRECWALSWFSQSNIKKSLHLDLSPNLLTGVNSRDNNPIQQHIQHVQSSLNELTWFNGDIHNTGAALTKLHLILNHIAKTIKQKKPHTISTKRLLTRHQASVSALALCGEPRTMAQLESYLDTIRLQTQLLTRTYKQSQLANKIDNTIVSFAGLFLVSQVILDHSSETLWPTMIAVVLLTQSQLISNILSMFSNSDCPIQTTSIEDNMTPRQPF